MDSYESPMFHKAYPLDSFLEEAKRMEKEQELMLSYLPPEYREMQRKVEETCDKMEYEGSRMYDEHPDGGMIRQLAGRILERLKTEHNESQSELDGSSFWMTDGGNAKYQEDMVCCFLCNEMFRRRYRAWCGKRYIR